MSRPTRQDLQLLLDTSRRLNETLLLEPLLAEIRALTREAVSARAVSLFVWDEATSALECYVLADAILGERERPSLPVGTGVAGWVAQTGRGFLTNDAANDPLVLSGLAAITHALSHKRVESAPDAEAIPPARFLAVPLRRANNVFGVLEAMKSRDEAGFETADLQLLQTLGDPISVALDNALTLQLARRERAQNEALYRIGLVLNEKLGLEEIIEVLLDQIRTVIPYDAAALYLLDPGGTDLSWFQHRGYAEGTEDQVNVKLGHGLVGWVAGTGEPLIVPDVREEPRYVNARDRTRSEMVVPIVTEGRMLGVLNLEADAPGYFTHPDVRVARSFANQAAISIERARITKELESKHRLAHELEVARRIQQSFLPARDPDLPGFDLSGTNLSSVEVSGDVYDYIDLAEGQIGILVGDVSGKGVPAAIIMAALRASLRAEARHHYSIAEIVTKVNRLLVESVEPGRFVTAVYGVLDTARRVFSYVNAGHNAPVLLRRSGHVERLRIGGPILGPFLDAQYELGLVELGPGDVLTFYTDGVTEAGAPEFEPYGADRLIRVLRRTRTLSSREIHQRVVEDVVQHLEGAPRSDDITVVVLKVLGESDADPAETLPAPGAGTDPTLADGGL